MQSSLYGAIRLIHPLPNISDQIKHSEGAHIEGLCAYLIRIVNGQIGCQAIIIAPGILQRTWSSAPTGCFLLGFLWQTLICPGTVRSGLIPGHSPDWLTRATSWPECGWWNIGFTDILLILCVGDLVFVDPKGSQCDTGGREMKFINRRGGADFIRIRRNRRHAVAGGKLCGLFCWGSRLCDRCVAALRFGRNWLVGQTR